MLHEHWLYDSQTRAIPNRFCDISLHYVSGMNDNCLLFGGRGYGGFAILWRSSLSCTVEPVVVVNNRVSIVLINIHGTRLLLCCVYMPCDTNYDRDNIDINNSVFNDIFDSNLCNNVNHILIGDDFQTDLYRTQSAYTMSLN